METFDSKNNLKQNTVLPEITVEMPKPQSKVNSLFEIYAYIVLILTVIGCVFIFIDMKVGGYNFFSVFIIIMLSFLYLSFAIVYMLKTSLNIVFEKRQTGANISSVILKNHKIAVAVSLTILLFLLFLSLIIGIEKLAAHNVSSLLK